MAGSSVAFVARNEAGRTPREEMVYRHRAAADGAGDRLAALEFESAPVFTAVTDNPDAARARMAGGVSPAARARRGS